MRAYNRKTKTYFSTLVTTCALSLVLSVPVFATTSGTLSIDEIVSGTQPQAQVTQPEQTQTQPQQQQQQQTQQGGTDDVFNSLVGENRPKATDGDLINSLIEYSDMTVESDVAKRAQEPLARLFGGAAQLISYVICLALTVFSLLGIAYIKIPPVRGLLLPSGQQQPQQGMGMNRGFGGGMHGGFGGMNGGFGGMNGGFGGMNGGFGGGMNGGMGGQQQQMPSVSGFHLVPDAAVRAVAMDGQVGANGKPISALGFYTRDMVVTFVLVPVLLTLALSGAMAQLGFAVGMLLSSFLKGIGGMFL